MNELDFVVTGILLFSFLLGLWRGLVYEVMALLGWPIAFVLSKMFAGNIATLLPLPALSRILDLGRIQWAPETVRISVSYALVFIVVLIVWSILAKMLSKLLNLMGSGPVDRVMGGMFGLMRGVLVVIVLVWLAGLTSFFDQPLWRNAIMSKTLENAAVLTKSWMPDNLVQRTSYRIRS